MKNGDDVREYLASLPDLGWQLKGMKDTIDAVGQVFADRVDDHGLELALMGLIYFSATLARKIKPGVHLNAL